MRSRLLASTSLAALLAAACGSTTTTPILTPAPALSMVFSADTWSSTAPIPSQQGTCGGFTWKILSITELSASGDFSATCNGSIQVSGTGTAFATRDRMSIAWSGGGMAAGTGIPNCMVELSGTVDATASGFRITYGGSTCLGNISGVETLARK